MKRRKPTQPTPLVRTDPRFVVHRPSVQALPPTQPRPRKKIGHAVKYVSPSVRYGTSNTQPIKRRAAIFFGGWLW